MLQDFDHAIRHDDIWMDAEEKMTRSNNTVCSAITCVSVTRNYRERNVFGRPGANEITKLYGVANAAGHTNANDSDKDLYKMTISDIMDTIHIELYHTIRISPDEITDKEQELKSEQQKVKVTEDDDGLYDRYCDAVLSIIRVKDKAARFDRGDKERYGKANNKFMTVGNQQNNIDRVLNDMKETELFHQKDNETEEISNEDDETMIDAVFNEVAYELKKMGVSSESTVYAVLMDYILSEKFDSDALCEDLMEDNNGKTSNIIQYLRSKSAETATVKGPVELISNICISMAYGVNIFAYEYQPGIRYFYWNSYKKMNYEESGLFRMSLFGGDRVTESNPGYLISDWYIKARWSNLKEEALNNSVAPYMAKEYQLTWIKAKIKLNAYQTDSSHRKLWASDEEWAKFIYERWKEWRYGIKEGDTPTTEHICALMMYTNFTRNCTAFSSTFRRRTGYETDRKLKQRHSQVAIQARLLRELIEAYGQTMYTETSFTAGHCTEYDHINTFYHGVNKAMIFQSTTIKLCGPVSTSIDFITSAKTFAAQGIVLSIKRENTCKPFIDCGTFSDFSYEREFLFLGGLFPLKITSIRDIPSKANYAPFIQAMSIFQNMIDGKSTRLREPTLSDFRCLLYLMANEIDGWFTLETKRKSNSKIPIFIGNLFKHFALSVAEVKIRLTHFETAGEIEFDEKDIVDWEFGGHRCLYPEQYGLRLFMPLLFDKETQTRPNLELFLSLFSNINKLVIFSTYFHADKMEERYGPSLVLDDDFCNDVLDTIKFMQKKNIKFGLKSIIICNPKSSISEFCETQQEKFTAINWKLYGDLYNHSFYSGTQSLYIAPKD